MTQGTSTQGASPQGTSAQAASPQGASHFVIAANRLPVRWSPAKNKWEPSPGGLVSAMLTSLDDLAPLHWVGWTGVAGDAHAEFDKSNENMSFLAVPLSRAETELYYSGMSNATIWPLYHDGVRPPEFHRTWWNSYVEVNRRFCDAVVSVAAPGATVWVHDYHLQLLPKMLREQRPDVKIGFFLHIPFPPADLFARLPFRQQIMEGLLGADLIGVQTKRSRGNLRRTAEFLGAAEAERDDLMIVRDSATALSTAAAGTVSNNPATTSAASDNPATNSPAKHTPAAERKVMIERFAIGIDVVRFEEAAQSRTVQQRAEEIREMIGVDKVLLGVDRLDYTKGIDIRMRAFGELLTEELFAPGECSMVQVAEPSRSNVNQYVDLREHVEQLVGKINGLHGQLGRQAIHYFHKSQPFEEIVAMYLAADVMLVTPLRDGMNLVAKEYAAARRDNTGVLVLSEFAGASELLREAILVNPYDIDGLKRAITEAVRMPAAVASAKMEKMREAVAGNDVHDWVRNFVNCLDAGPDAAKTANSAKT